MTAPLKSVTDPSITEVLRQHARDIFRLLRVAAPGRIEAFDKTKKTATVQLLFKRTLPDGTVRSYPPMVDVPVWTLQGGGVWFRAPIKQGDQCLVLFADRNLDAWHKTGGESALADARAHDLSDAVALVGLDSLGSAQTDYPTDEGQIIAGNARVAVKADGSAAGVQQGAADVTAINGKLRLKNGATDLLTLLSNLIQAIEGVTITDPQGGTGVVSAASVAALEAQKTALAGLLTSS